MQKTTTSSKRLLRRLLLGLGTFLILVIGLLLAIPYFFKDRIIDQIEAAANAQLSATFSFSDVGLSLIRSFPDFSLRIDSVRLTGQDEFEGLDLLQVERMRATIDLSSILNSDRPIAIKNVQLDAPHLYIKVLKNGRANYDIVKPMPVDTTTSTDTTAPPSAIQIALKRYGIRDAFITYDDATLDVFVDLADFDHSGKGDFTATTFDLKTTSTAQALTVAYAGVPYLNKTNTRLDLDLGIDLSDAQNMQFNILKGDATLNALGLSLTGNVGMRGTDIDLDLAFSSVRNDFKDLLSMVPAAYSQDFADVQAKGQMSVKGSIQGTYNAQSLPAFDVSLMAKDGQVQYPDLPLPIADIQVDMRIQSPSADLDQMTVKVSQFHFDLNQSPFDLKFALRTPMSDPDVKAEARGTLILDDLAKAFPLGEQGIKQFGGTLKTDLKAAMRLSDVEAQRYDAVTFAGALEAFNVVVQQGAMPTIQLQDLKMECTPQQIRLPLVDVQLGKSDFVGSGRLDNILTYFSKSATLTGNFTVRSDLFDANEWLTALAATPSEAPSNAPSVQIEDTTTAPGAPVDLDRFDLALDAQIQQIRYESYTIDQAVAQGHFKADALHLDELSLRLGKSDFLVRGELRNLGGYLFDGETLRGDALWRSSYLDADELMAIAMPPSDEAKGGKDDPSSSPSTGGLSAKAPSTPSGAAPIFGKFDVNADVQIGAIDYAPYHLKNIAGIGNFQHEVIDVSDFQLQIGNSDFRATGHIENAIDWLFYPNEPLTGVVDLSSRFLDVNQFMLPAEETDRVTAAAQPAQPTPTSEIAPLVVPAGVDLVLNAHFKEVRYSAMRLTDAEGAIAIADQAINLSDITANAFGGKMQVTGGYDSKQADQPAFDLALQLVSFELNKAFEQVSTVRLIAPIAEYVEGKFNTTFTISGLLGKDMMPDLNSLNSRGLLETINAAIRGFKPVNEMASKLRVNDLKDLELKDSKNSFVVENGFVVITPFEVKVKDIHLNIGGRHGLQKAMDYDIKVRVPRRLLEKSAAGNAANQGIDWLGAEARKLGLNVQQGEYLNFLVELGGMLKSPDVKVKLLGMDGSDVVDATQQQIGAQVDSLKSKAQATADSLKAAADARLKAEEARLRALAQARADSLKRVAEQKIKEQTGQVINEAKDKLKDQTQNVSDSLKNRTQSEIDKLKDKIGDDVKDKAKSKLDKLKNKFGKRDQ